MVPVHAVGITNVLLMCCDGACACSWHYWKIFSPSLREARGHNLPHLLYGLLIYTVSIYASFKVQPLASVANVLLMCC
jgi:hypothetical protein